MKAFTNAISVLGGLLFVTAVANAQPIVEYSFPTSWDGTGTVVTDLSGAGNDGSTAGNPALSPVIPSSADPLTQSLFSTSGGIQTDATQLLSNTTLEAAGGFMFEVSFRWNADPSGNALVQKIIDYAGTEFLQLENIDTGNDTADLRFGFNDAAGVGPTMSIVADQWYSVVATFDTQGNTINSGELAGMATMVVNNGAPITESVAKGTLGDGLDRSIGIGTFAVASGILNMTGLIHAPTITLLPEPSSLVLLGLSVLLIGRRR